MDSKGVVNAKQGEKKIGGTENEKKRSRKWYGR